MYYQQRTGPRYEHRAQAMERVKEAPTLADEFPQLKSLAIDLGHYNPEGVTRNSQIKFTPNLDNAKAVFLVNCPNQGCIGGDFDLTEILADAVANQHTTVSDELCCQGWQSKTTINSIPCHNILRYTLHLEYQPVEAGR